MENGRDPTGYAVLVAKLRVRFKNTIRKKRRSDDTYQTSDPQAPQQTNKFIQSKSGYLEYVEETHVACIDSETPLFSITDSILLLIT